MRSHRLVGFPASVAQGKKNSRSTRTGTRYRLSRPRSSRKSGRQDPEEGGEETANRPLGDARVNYIHSPFDDPHEFNSCLVETSTSIGQRRCISLPVRLVHISYIILLMQADIAHRRNRFFLPFATCMHNASTPIRTVPPATTTKPSWLLCSMDPVSRELPVPASGTPLGPVANTPIQSPRPRLRLCSSSSTMPRTTLTAQVFSSRVSWRWTLCVERTQLNVYDTTSSTGRGRPEEVARGHPYAP